MLRGVKSAAILVFYVNIVGAPTHFTEMGDISGGYFYGSGPTYGDPGFRSNLARQPGYLSGTDVSFTVTGPGSECAPS